MPGARTRAEIAALQALLTGDELMAEIDDIASRLDPTDLEAARTTRSRSLD